MSSCGRRGSVNRRKPKKKTNRYNPNQPDWAAVHMPWWRHKTKKG